MKYLLFVLLTLVLFGCNQSDRHDSGSSEDNVLIDYVESPKNKARDVKDAVEGIDADRRKQLEAFDE